jgi:hypothetical protein
MLAYLDAASGSVIVAALAGGTAGIAVLFKMYWNRILGVFSPKRRAAAREAKAQLTGADDSDNVPSTPRP